VIGPLSVQSAELTGTGAGELFALYPRTEQSPATSPLWSRSVPTRPSARSTKTTGQLKTQSVLAAHSLGSAWALAYWGGDFYAFTAPDRTVGTIVTRFRPTDGSQVIVARTPDLIAGVGVSTCAPGP